MIIVALFVLFLEYLWKAGLLRNKTRCRSIHLTVISAHFHSAPLTSTKWGRTADLPHLIIATI